MYRYSSLYTSIVTLLPNCLCLVMQLNNLSCDSSVTLIHCYVINFPGKFSHVACIRAFCVQHV